MQVYAKACKCMQVYASVCKSMQKYKKNRKKFARMKNIAYLCGIKIQQWH